VESMESGRIHPSRRHAAEVLPIRDRVPIGSPHNRVDTAL
jgi:hypothetical protein